MNKRSHRRIEIVSLVTVAGVTAVTLGYVVWGTLVNPHAIGNKDVCFWLAWMAQFSNEKLFVNDLITNYVQFVTPFGFSLLYRMASIFVEPVTFSKILPFPLVIVTAIYLYRIGRMIAGREAGFATVAFFLFFPSHLKSFCGGIPHGFMFPLLVMALFYLMNARWLIVALLLFVGSLFYPLVSILGLPLFSLCIVQRSEGPLPLRLNGRGFGYLCAAALLCGAALFPKIVAENPEIGPTISAREAKAMPEMQKKGRLKVLPFKRLSVRVIENDFPDVYESHAKRFRPYLWLLLAAYAVALKKRALDFPWPLWGLALCSVFLYYLATLLAFRLYFPSRYVSYPFAVLICIVLGVNSVRFIRTFETRKRRIFASVIVFGLAVAFEGHKLDDASTVEECPLPSELLQFVQALPEDTLIAGHPFEMDWVMLFGKRKVFVTYEASSPIHAEYYKTMRERTRDFFRAYYADSEEPISEFLLRNDIDYLIVNMKHFEDKYLQRGKIYFQPINDEVLEMVGANNFYLEKAAETKAVFSKKGYIIIPSGALERRTDSLSKERRYSTPSNSVSPSSCRDELLFSRYVFAQRQFGGPSPGKPACGVQ